MENMFHHESEGTMESGVTPERVAKSNTLVGRSRNILLAIIAATEVGGCMTYGYTRPYYPERSNYYYDNGYRGGYYYNPPTHVIRAFPLRIERIDKGGHRGKHHR